MLIKGKSVRSLTKYLPLIGDGRRFRVGVPVSGNEEQLTKIGFPKDISPGMSLVPSEIGKYTDFNSRGREVVRMDLPLIPEFKMVYSSWKDWHGYPHSGFQYRTYQVRQKDLIDPPGEELTILQVQKELYVSSRELSTRSDSEEAILHIINLFLEGFEECLLLDKEASPILKVKQLNWHILPKGEYPWEVAKEHVEAYTSNLKDGDREVIEHRIRNISRHKPDLLAVGHGGFDGYFVFGFSRKNIFVLECPHFDNATYIFTSDWKELSKFTKKEILTGKHSHSRVIHNKAWSTAITRLLITK